MDLRYFTDAIPAADNILNIIIASGWALLLGNMVFQAAKSMMSGLGLEGEEPSQLFARTFLFAFLLLASRQICEIGLGMTGTIMDMLIVPDSVSISLPEEDIFGIGASWLLMIIVGIVLMWQIVKLFFAVGERYFLVGFLTIAAPWAFAMGGSKNTADIFKGWVRMFASMCLMMILNVVFLKMLLSAMGNMPNDGGIVAWIIFVTAICRVARKMDTMIMRIGLNPVPAGDGLGRSFLGSTASYLVMRGITSGVTKAVGSAAGKAKTTSGGAPPPPAGAASTSSGRNTSTSTSSASNRGGTSQSTANTRNASTQNSNNTSQNQQATQATAAQSGASGTNTVQAGSTNGFGQTRAGEQQYFGSHGTAGKPHSGIQQKQNLSQSSARRTSVTNNGVATGTRGSAYRPGMAGTAQAASYSGKDGLSPLPQRAPSGTRPPTGTAGTRVGSDSGKVRPSRYSTVPQNAGSARGSVGTAGSAHGSRVHQGGVNMRASSHADMKNEVNNTINEQQHAAGSSRFAHGYVSANHAVPGAHGNTGTSEEKRGGSMPTNTATRYGRNAASKQSSSGSGSKRDSGNAAAPKASTARDGRNASHGSKGTQGATPSASVRDGRNSGFTPTGTNSTAARRHSDTAQRDTSRKTDKPQSGMARTRPQSTPRPTVKGAQDVAKQNARGFGGTDSTVHKSGAPGENRKSDRNKTSDDE